MKYLIVFIAFLLSISELIYAQDRSIDEPGEGTAENPDSQSENTDSQSENTDSQVEQPEQPAATEPRATEQNNPDFDVFQPTEDISEDLAVPFPVDI